MSTCLQCGAELRLGRLCSPHAEALATCAELTAEQVQASELPEPSAYLIDQWGNVHGITDRAVVGRVQRECEVTIFHHSISALHAQVEKLRNPANPSAPWRVVDRGSLNGTFVAGEQVRQSALTTGDIVRFGSVSFYFSSERFAESSYRPGVGYTVPTPSQSVVFHATVADDSGKQLALMQRAAGGIARLDEDTALEFARLEFALLKKLAEKRIEVQDPELAFVSSSELADLLEFKSRDADGENVRELVRRVRRKFRDQGIADLIESRQGVGYRLAWAVRN